MVLEKKNRIELIENNYNQGIASFDDNTGFWLVHSVPRWPNSAETPFYFPDNETKYAQSFICVTYDYLTFNDIGSQWKINKPYMYDTNLPSQFDADLPNVVDVLNHVFVTTVVANQTLVLTSNGFFFCFFFGFFIIILF